MSAKQMGLVFELAADTTRKMVMLALADHADPDGRHIFPSYTRVAGMTSLSKSTVRRVINELKTEGVLVEVIKASPRKPATFNMRIDVAIEAYGLRGSTVTPLPEDSDSDHNQNIDNSHFSEGETVETGRGVTVTPLNPDDGARGVTGHPQGCHGDPSGVPSCDTRTLSNPHEPSGARAREAVPETGSAVGVPDTPASTTDAAPDGPDVCDTVENAAKELVCAHWRSKEGELRHAFGDGFFKSWLANLIPETDDGRVLVLAAPSKFKRDWLSQRHTIKLSKVVGRKVEIVHRGYAHAAAERSRAHGVG